jgi:hypothetical protein
MRMRLLLLIILSLSLTSFAKMTSHSENSDIKSSTASYYASVMGLSGFKLKTALSAQLRRTHQDRGYGSLLSIYFKSDADTSYDNDGSIMDMYSENPSSYDSYNFSNRKQACGSYKGEADCFNREHLFPQSAFGKSRPMRNDFFHVYPSALLYFGTRYEDRIGSFNHAMLDGSRDKVYAGWFMKLLLKWHKQDPVSKHEIQRNEVGYQYQGNRNPFIDHPEWVDSIWGTL